MSEVTQKRLENGFSTAWRSTNFPPSSPDLSLLHYGIWKGLEESRTCKILHPIVDALKAVGAKKLEKIVVAFVRNFSSHIEGLLREVLGCHFKKWLENYPSFSCAKFE